MLGSILLVLAVSEVAVRRLSPQYMSLHVHPARIWKDDFMAHDRLGMYNELLGWTPKPNAKIINKTWECSHEICTNSRGFRCDEIPFERQPGMRRILILGDSFGMGDGVQRGEIFADRLSQLLPNTEVVNLSVNGYGTDQELLLYRIEGSRYDADVVLLAFTVSNDVFGNGSCQASGMNKPYFVLDAKKLVLEGVPVPYTTLKSRKIPGELRPSYPIHDWLDSHSGLYAMIFHRLTSIEILRRHWQECGLLYEQETVFYPQQLEILEVEPKPPTDKAWQITENLLVRLRERVIKQGATLVVVLIPSQLQVYQEIWERAARVHKLDRRRFDLEGPNARLTAFCMANSIHVLDLLPQFRCEAPRCLPLYYRRNPHWTPEGHRVAANAIADFLKKDILQAL